jgi:hypothetical protein
MTTMNLNDITNRQWSIYACSALKGEGISEGMSWLIETISKNNS